MNKNTLLTRLAAIITALDELSGSPESMLYIFCEMDMSDYQTIRHVLVRAGYVKISGNYVTLTELGKTTAKELNKVISK